MFVVLEIRNGVCFFEAQIDKYTKVAVVAIEKISDDTESDENQQESSYLKTDEQAEINSEL